MKSGEKDANGRQASATNKRGYLQRGKFYIWLLAVGCWLVPFDCAQGDIVVGWWFETNVKT